MGKHFNDMSSLPGFEAGQEGERDGLEVDPYEVDPSVVRPTTPAIPPTPASTEPVAGYVSAVSDKQYATGGRDRRYEGSAYAETDPYDLDGVRQGNTGRRTVRALSTLLFVAGLVLLVAAGGMWLKSQWEYHEQEVENEKLQAYAVVDDIGSEPPQVDWESLKAVNADVVAWLQIPGTIVNYPIYQGSSNDQYLRTNAEGSYSVGGQVFLDYENIAPGLVDHQSIVYGHHLYNGTMFKPIADMDNQQMFDSVKTIWYVTELGATELEPLFLYYSTPEDTNVRQFEFVTNGSFQDYLAALLNRAVTRSADAEVVLQGTYHVLNLATCNYYDDAGRSFLICIPKDEAAAARTQFGAQ